LPCIKTLGAEIQIRSSFITQLQRLHNPSTALCITDASIEEYVVRARDQRLLVMNRVLAQIPNDEESFSTDDVNSKMSVQDKEMFAVVLAGLDEVMTYSGAAEKLEKRWKFNLSTLCPWFLGQSLDEMKADPRTKKIKQMLMALRIGRSGNDSKVIALAQSANLRNEHPKEEDQMLLLKKARNLRHESQTFVWKLINKSWEQQVILLNLCFYTCDITVSNIFKKSNCF